MKPKIQPRWRTVTIVFLVAVAAVALAGCVKMQTDFDIKADETYSATIAFGYSEEAIQALADISGQSVDELLREFDFADQMEELEDQFGSDASSEPWSEGGYTGTKITISDQPLASLSGGVGSDDLSIVLDGDTFTLNGTLDLSATQAELANLGAMGGAEPTIQFSFTFPGPVLSSSGQISGNTTTFDIELGKQNVLTAEASAGPGAAPTPTADPPEEPTDEPAPPEEPPATTATPDEPAAAPEATIPITPISDDVADEGSSGISTLLLIALIAGGVILIALIILIIALARRSAKQKAAAGQPAGGEAMAFQPYGQPMATPTQQFAPPVATPAEQFMPPAAAPPVPGYPVDAPPPAPGYPQQQPPPDQPTWPGQGYPPAPGYPPDAPPAPGYPQQQPPPDQPTWPGQGYPQQQ